MADIPNPEQLGALASLLAPGVVILVVRERFRGAISRDLNGRIISFALVSIVYSAVVYPIFHAKDGVELPHWLWQLLLTFVVPLAVSMAIVLFDRSEWFYRISNKLGLRPAHHDPTAWDYAYKSQGVSYIIVHLTEGSTVAGVWDEGSFASSVSGDRDLLISRLWTVEEDGWVEVLPPRAMLVCGGAIRMVEFIQGGGDE